MSEDGEEELGNGGEGLDRFWSKLFESLSSRYEVKIRTSARGGTRNRAAPSSTDRRPYSTRPNGTDSFVAHDDSLIQAIYGMKDASPLWWRDLNSRTRLGVGCPIQDTGLGFAPLTRSRAA